MFPVGEDNDGQENNQEGQGNQCAQEIENQGDECLTRRDGLIIELPRGTVEERRIHFVRRQGSRGGSDDGAFSRSTRAALTVGHR